MKERFSETFTLVDRAVMNSSWGANVWEERGRCITSLDFVRQDNVQATLRGAQCDLVIVDEAHKMSAYSYPAGSRRGAYGRDRSKVDMTRRYLVGFKCSCAENGAVRR